MFPVTFSAARIRTSASADQRPVINLGKSFASPDTNFRDLIGTAYRPSITSLQESEDVLSRHWEDLETL